MKVGELVELLNNYNSESKVVVKGVMDASGLYDFDENRVEQLGVITFQVNNAQKSGNAVVIDADFIEDDDFERVYEGDAVSCIIDDDDNEEED